jgi:glycosyltransferase involved in cell wall biosynthesis
MQGTVWLVLDLDAKKRGTMEEQLVALAQRLRSEGIRVAMVFSRPPAEFPGAALRRLGVDVRNLDFRSSESPAILAAWLHRERPDVVHFHFIEPYSAYVVAAKLAGARVLVHDHVVVTPPRSILRALVRRARGLALNWMVDRRIAVSAFAGRATTEGHFVVPQRVDVVQNAVSVARFAGCDGRRIRAELGLGNAPLVVSVARLDEEKGGAVLLRAMSLLDGPAHLAMVGEGPREASWRALAGTLGLSGRVHFLGLRNDVEQILAAASVVVVPSEWEEAFGLATIEAMAASKPVIVTRSGAMPEIVGDAALVVPRSNPPSLARAIAQVLADRVLAQRLATAGRARVESHYSMDRYVNRMLETYRSFLPEAGATPIPRLRRSRTA